MGSYGKRLRIYFILLAAVFAIGVAGFSLLEGFSWLDSFYFTLVTIATVGYGDVHPVTVPGKVLAMVVIVTGVGCFIGVVVNVVEHMIYRYEQTRKQEKTDMLVGLFFSSLGTGLLREFARKDPDRTSLAPVILETQSAGPGEFSRLLSGLDRRTFRLDAGDFDLPAFRDTLGQNVQFLLLLLQNPDLEEHDRFSDLLFATLHLWQELMSRDVLTDLPDPDLAHLSVDLNRIYAAILKEWVIYLRQVKERYPFLHSLALRTNPFDDSAEVIIRK
jgi:hypothetical protein